jgi:hypothetical protein
MHNIKGVLDLGKTFPIPSPDLVQVNANFIPHQELSDNLGTVCTNTGIQDIICKGTFPAVVTTSR